MKKLCLAFVALLAVTLFCPSSKADSVLYSLSGVFGADASNAPLSGPDGSFEMLFSLPQMPTPDYTDAGGGDFAVFSVPFLYFFKCDGCSTPVLFSGSLDDVVFGDPSLNLVVEFVTGGHDYYWQFTGTQLFTGTLDHPSLIAGGEVNLVNGGQFELDDDPFVPVGNATLTAQTVSTPEPSSLALLIAAFASLGLLVWFKAKHP